MQCLIQHGFTQLTTYQPASRFWPFQGSEGGWLLALSLLYRVAATLGEDESYLWPGAVDRASLTGAELVASYPRRTDVPRHLWTELLAQAQRSVDVLAFAGLFLAEEPSDWTPLLAARAASI